MKYSRSIALLSLILLLCGCGAVSPSPVAEPIDAEPAVEDTARATAVEEPTADPVEAIYTMEDLHLAFAQKAALKGHTLSFSMINQSQSSLCWGYDLVLEVLSAGQWVPIDRMTELNGLPLEIPPDEYILLPGNTDLVSLDLKHYGVETLENGTYRVLIPISIEGTETVGLLEIPVVIES